MQCLYIIILTIKGNNLKMLLKYLHLIAQTPEK